MEKPGVFWACIQDHVLSHDAIEHHVQFGMSQTSVTAYLNMPLILNKGLKDSTALGIDCQKGLN